MSCASCGRLIVSGSIITALNHKYHDACFKCAGCQSYLSGSFYGCDDKPYCENCIDAAENAARSRPAAPPPASDNDTGDAVPVAKASRDGDDSDDLRHSSHGDGGGGGGGPPASSASPDYDACKRCRQLIVSGSVVNALESTFHENCFLCCDPGCGKPLDAFYGCEGLPYCPDHIDAAEDRAAAGIPAPQQAPAHDDYVEPSTATKPVIPKTVLPSAASLPASADSSSMWEDLARRADERSEQLEEKLKHIKMALAEERKTAGQEYAEIQRELEAERSKNAQLQQRIAALERQVQDMSRGGGQELSSSVDRCNKLEKENLELAARANKLELELRDANERIASAPVYEASAAPPAFDGGGFAPPPPPPPPGAPPPPPMTNVMNVAPLKITRSGQSAQVHSDAPAEANPQADLISELKKGRPQLRRTAAQRPSKKDILTRNANARMQEEQRRPDPSLVKGADTGNSVARNMASNAEKSAGLAQERTERVKTGEIRMRAHRNKYLDQILDTIK